MLLDPNLKFSLRIVQTVRVILHSEVSVDITGEGFPVEHKVVADNVECQAGAPVGRGVICGTPCCGVTTTPFLLLCFFFLTLCDQIGNGFPLKANDQTLLDLQ